MCFVHKAYQLKHCFNAVMIFFLKFFFLLQEEVMTLERILLQTIKFDLQVEHPYSFLLKYAKSLKGKYPKLLKFILVNYIMYIGFPDRVTLYRVFQTTCPICVLGKQKKIFFSISKF